MQQGFTDELQRLRSARCHFCGERWFAAQTPTQVRDVAEGQYTCDRCKYDKKRFKSFSSASDMNPGSVPDQLKGLTQAEEMLIAKGCPVMRVYRLKGVDLGKPESTAGLTFACLSRAKRLADPLIEPMPLERLSEIGDTPTFQLRLREEVRLNALAGETLRLRGSVE